MRSFFILALHVGAITALYTKTLSYALQTVVKDTLGGLCCEGRTYMELIRIVSNDFADPIYLKGGLVRDLVHTNNTANFLDVDVGFNAPFATVAQRLTSAGVHHLSMPDFHFFTVGPMNGPHLDGTGLYGQGPTGYDLADVETPANALMMQLLPGTMVVLDLLDGKGIADANANVWRAPQPPGTLPFTQWVEEHNKPGTASHRLLWRMIKFKLRNFTVPDDTAAAVYTYWLSRRALTEPQWEKVWTLLPSHQAAAVGAIVKADLEQLKLGYTFEDFVRTLVARRGLYRLSMGRTSAGSPPCPRGVNRYAGVCLVPASLPSREFLALGIPAFCCAEEDEEL
jgi:hypothetical protein